MNEQEIKQKLEDIKYMIEPILDDNAIPRNIRRAVDEAKNKISEINGDLDVKIASAIYSLDEVANDINMPFHARTDIWNLVKELEKLKEELK